MRRTITTPNHFITSIPNWRVKVKIAGVFFFFVLLLLSCKDELSYIGFHKAPKLGTHYVEIPLNPSVIQMRGVITENDANSTNPRILVGRYNDPDFGNMDVRGFSNYAPPIVYTKPSAGATVDSLILQVTFDFYHYGSGNTATQRLQIFEVLDTIHSDFIYVSGKDTVIRLGYYANNSNIAISNQVIGDVSFDVNPAYFDESLPLNQDADTTNNRVFQVRIKITSPTLANDLLNDMINDSTLVADFARFTGKYKGLAFVMNSGDQILGINPKYTAPLSSGKDTRLSLYYTDAGVQTRADFLLNRTVNASTGQQHPVVSFTTLTSDYTVTALNGILPFTDFQPFGNSYYVQSMTALVTKYDLTNFYKYLDTVQYAVFNSAELGINNTSTRPPYAVQLRVLDDNNNFRSPYIDSLVNGIVQKAYDPYFQKMSGVLTFGPVTTPTVDINTDIGVSFPIFTDTYGIPVIYMTNFCQSLYAYKTDPHRIKSFALMPSGSEFQNSVNSLVVDKTAVLKLYYSKPVVKIR